MSEDIDWEASSPASEEILKGTYTNTKNLTALCKQLLEECRSQTQLNSVQDILTKEEFRGKITRWNEQTSTSPSGRHLGRYKSLYSPSKYQEGSAEAEEFEAKQQAIIHLILRIINYCIRTGYPLRRWCQTLNTMIFKDHGIFKIHRLRVIHIFEADLNLLYACKWRQLVNHADANHLIHSGQFGGRPGYEATTMALLEELRIDVSIMTRRTLMTFDNDAASCYDRITINLASVVNRKYGLHKNITAIHGKVLGQTNYSLITANGVSTRTYRHSATAPLYGTGQGAGNSPGIWLLISSTLFDTYDRESNGAKFVSQDGTVTMQMGLCGFVDDTNAVVNTFQRQHDTPSPEIRNRLQEDAQRWTELLYISGGKLELTKCSYHALQFQFKSDGTPVPTLNPAHPPIRLIDPTTSSEVYVPCLQSTTAHKILGHWKAPCDPRQRKQMEEILTKSKQQAILIATSPLTRQGARLAYNGIYVSSLRYVLPQCWFSPIDLASGEKKSMPMIISKCGLAKTTPHALLYAPNDLAGAGFLHWTTIQGEGQVRHFLKHWRTNNPVSKLLRIALSWAQWQAGTGISILKNVVTPLPHLEGRWISSLRQFLSSIQAYITVDTHFTPNLEREGDITIMDFAIQSGEFTTQELKIVNYCRLYMHAYTISDLIDATGRKMLRYMFECTRPPWFDTDTYITVQRQPSLYQRHFQWKRLCRLLCQEDLQVSPAYQLSRWLVPGQKLRLRREGYIHHTNNEDQVYIWRQGKYWAATPHRNLPHNYELQEPTDWTPENTCTPLDITHFFSPRRCAVQNQLHFQSEQNPPKKIPRDFLEYVQHLESWEQDLLQHIDWKMAPFEIMHFLQHQWKRNDQLLIVSDGSSHELKAMSFGVVVGTSAGLQLVEIMGPAYGKPTSHRAECTGALAGAILLRHLQMFTGTDYPSGLQVKAMSDNQGMIKSLTSRLQYNTPYPNATLVPDWDILEEIHYTYTQIGMKHLEYEWL